MENSEQKWRKYSSSRKFRCDIIQRPYNNLNISNWNKIYWWTFLVQWHFQPLSKLQVPKNERDSKNICNRFHLEYFILSKPNSANKTWKSSKYSWKTRDNTCRFDEILWFLFFLCSFLAIYFYVTSWRIHFAIFHSVKYRNFTNATSKYQ